MSRFVSHAAVSPGRRRASVPVVHEAAPPSPACSIVSARLSALGITAAAEFGDTSSFTASATPSMPEWPRLTVHGIFRGPAHSRGRAGRGQGADQIPHRVRGGPNHQKERDGARLMGSRREQGSDGPAGHADAAPSTRCVTSCSTRRPRRPRISVRVSRQSIRMETVMPGMSAVSTPSMPFGALAESPTRRPWRPAPAPLLQTEDVID